MSIKIKDIENVFWIDRDEAVGKLTDGFVELFGEESREFIENLQDEMIEEGISAGRKGYRYGSLGKMSMIKVSQKFAKTEEERQVAKEWFLKFFTQEEYDLVVNEDPKIISGGSTGSIYPYYKNQGKYEKVFVDRFSAKKCDGSCKDQEECWCNTEPPKLYKKSPPSFRYFKKLKHDYMGLNMFGEGGLSLDRWDAGDLNYMISENEWFYLPESIHRSYYYLGAQIGKCMIKEEFFNEILEKMEPGIPYSIQSTLKNALEGMSTDYDERVLIPIIREEFVKKFGEGNDLDGFKTRKEIRESIDKFMTPEKEKELLDLFKNKKI
jgi:hypothetical protein